MAVENQTDSIFAGNYRKQRFTVTDEDNGDVALDLTGMILKWALCLLVDGQPLKDSPVLDFASDDASPQVVITNAAGGIVEVELLPENTEDLTPGDYYFELELFDSLETAPVVVATGTLTIKPNVVNA